SISTAFQSPAHPKKLFLFAFKILLLLLILYVRSRLKEQGPPPEQQVDNETASDKQKTPMSSSPPATSRSGTPSKQQADRSPNDIPVLPRESRKRSSRNSKKKQQQQQQHENYSDDAPRSPGNDDSVTDDRSDIAEVRPKSTLAGVARASDSGIATDYTTDSPSHKQSRTSSLGIADNGSPDNYRKSAGRRLTQHPEQGRTDDPRKRQSRHINSRLSDDESRQEAGDKSHPVSDSSSVATDRVRSKHPREEQLSPSSSSSQRQTRSRDARRKKTNKEQQQQQHISSNDIPRQSPSRETQDIPLDKPSGAQEKYPDRNIGFKDSLRFGPKDTTLPDKFTSGPLLEQLGLDENDVQKFMKAYGEYNKIMAKENRPGFDMPADFGTIFGCKPLEQRSDGHNDESVLLPPPLPSSSSSPSADQGPSPEMAEVVPEEAELLKNNIKCDPPPPERTLTDLVGKTVDRAGNILGDDGSVIGKVNPDLSYLDGMTVAENGDIVDMAGKVYGTAEVVVAPKPTDKKEKKPGSTFRVGSGDDDLVVNVDAHKGGISFSIHIPRPK
ncbi:hypothetical protein BX666DRAFT_149819, partial [Dichotomocladium elegans]